MSEGVKRKCLDLQGLCWFTGQVQTHLESEKDTFPPAWDYMQPTSADVQVDGWWRCRFLSPYTNMCSPLYWMTFFRHRFLSETGMQRKTIACFHKTETDSKLLMGQLQGQVAQIKCTQANKTEKTCEDYRGSAASFVYIKCLYLQMRIHDSAVKILYWKHWEEKKMWNSHLCFYETLGYFMRNQFSILHASSFLISGRNLKMCLSWFVKETISLTRSRAVVCNGAQKLSDPKYLWALKSSTGLLPIIPNYFHIKLSYLSCNKSFLHSSDFSCSSWLFKGRMSSVVQSVMTFDLHKLYYKIYFFFCNYILYNF